MAGTEVCTNISPYELLREALVVNVSSVVSPFSLSLIQPKLNEQPVAESGGRKRPAENDENLEPVVPSDMVPPPKQPRTIDINLPNRWEDFASSENTPKGIYNFICISEVITSNSINGGKYV